MREPGSPRGGGRTAGGTRFDPGGVHAIREAPPGPRLGCEPTCPHPCQRAWVPRSGSGRHAGHLALPSEPPRLTHHAGPVFPACALVATRPLPDSSAPHWAPLISFGRAPRQSASEAGFRSAPGAPKALAPLVARPAVYPTGPAARGYDAGDDMTTSRPLGCMHPWSSSVGQRGKG